MEGSGDKYCQHLPQLTKDALRMLTEEPLQPRCSLHGHPFYYICLHCRQPCCLSEDGPLSCLESHFRKNPSHFFALQMEQGGIYCSACQDTIQNLIFIYGKPEEDNYLRMNRFATFVQGVWKQISAKLSPGKQVVLVRGLSNLGNTCFLNVVLQTLNASPSLTQLYQKMGKAGSKLTYDKRCVPKEVEYFYDEVLQKSASQKWNLVGPKGRKEPPKQRLLQRQIRNAEFNILLKQFFQEMSSQEKSSISPGMILDFLASVSHKYGLNEEQDAEELLLLVIDLLSEGERVSLLSEPERYTEVEKVLGFQKLVPVQSVFGFYLMNEVQCAQCKAVTSSLTLSYNLPLTLELKEQETLDLEHSAGPQIDYWEEVTYPRGSGTCVLLDPFFRVERLSLSSNYYSCGKCKSVLAFRKHYMLSPPQVLLISLKRFTSGLQKDERRALFEEEIEIGGYCLGQEAVRYSLVALIVHQGSSLRSGHYVCMVRKQQHWLLCSDERVQLVDWRYVSSHQAYVLLYQRKQ